MICIYEANVTDWHGNGLCIQQPFCRFQKGVQKYLPCNNTPMRNLKLSLTISVLDEK